MGIGIGERIKLKRIENGLTQLELAKRMGYTSKAAICKVETGEDNITTDRIDKFAKALNCSPSYLMGWDDIIDLIPDPSPTMEDINKILKKLDEDQLRQALSYLQFLASNKD